MFLEHDQICSFVVQLLSHVLLCDFLDCSTPGFPVLHYTRLPCASLSPGVCANSGPSSWWCHPTISSSVVPSPPALNLSLHQGLLHWLGSLHQVTKYWSISISPSNEYSGMISFRIDWFDFPAVQGTLKSLLQYHSSKVSILWCPAIFMVQLSHPYMTTGKNIALNMQTIWPINSTLSHLFREVKTWVHT